MESCQPNAWTISPFEGSVLLFQSVYFMTMTLKSMEASGLVGYQAPW